MWEMLGAEARVPSKSVLLGSRGFSWRGAIIYLVRKYRCRRFRKEGGMLFFDWWAKRRCSLKEQQLRKRVSQNLSFLFSELGAKFIPNEEYSSRARVVHATLKVGHLRLRAVEIRDGFYMEVAAAYSPKQWEEMGTVLEAIDAKQPVKALNDIPRQPTYLPLSTLAPLLKQRFADLQESLSEPNYAATCRAIEGIKQIKRREYDQEMQKRVQFHRDHPDAKHKNGNETVQSLGLNDTEV